jgi:hypothetical protein
MASRGPSTPARTAGGALLLSAVVLLPVAPGLFLGQGFFFRDLSRHFFPLRRFAAEGLRRGELRWWNPFVQEGVPLSLPPISYLPDLLQLLWIDERWFSILLALHLPLAALGMAALGRALGASPLAAAGGALVYAMGGFALSTLNFYIYLQALAWAPLVILGLWRAAGGGVRQVALAALAIAACLSTTGIEIALQALAVGLVLSLRRRPPAASLRLGASLLLGLGLAAPTLLALRDLTRGSAREAGLPIEVVLAHSIHPLTFLQTAIASLHGDMADPVGRWWGQNFFPLGFPYFLSLYLGATALGLATAALLAPGPHRRRLAAIGLLAAVACLGRWAGGEWALRWLGASVAFRIPAKAFFTVHLVVALLVGFALSDLVAGRWRRRQTAMLLPAAGLALLPAVLLLVPALARWLLQGFFPPEMPWADRVAASRFALRDGATGAVFALAGAASCWLAGRRQLAPPRAVGILCSLLAADLLRTAVGLNPTVTPSFYTLSEGTQRQVERLRAADGRVLTCDIEGSPAYLEARARRGTRHAAWSFAILRETLTPGFNVRPGVRSALGRDLTTLVPPRQVLTPEEAGCGSLDRMLPRARAAGVTELISIAPLAHPELALAAVVRPREIAPLPVHYYALAGALPRLSVTEGGGRVRAVRERAGRIEVQAEASSPGLLRVRDSSAPGWSAARNGRPVSLAPAEHLAVPLAPGPNEVVFTYRPPSLSLGLGCLAVSGLAALILGRGRPSRPAGGA